MSDKHYIGLDVTSFENTGKHKPVSRVTLFVDEENYYTSGDDTGKEITASCPSATQEMADTLLAKFVGYEHQSFNADSANIDPAAELGDGVTVGGIYATLSRLNDAGTGYAGISAADEPELEEEYPYLSPIQQEINRQSTETRSLITKKAEEITLKVENLSENVGHTLRVAADGVTITDADGKAVTISGGQIDAKTINTQDLHLTGVISFGDLSDAEDIQKQIDEAGGISASDASSIASTLITNTLVSSPTIQGATIKGGTYYGNIFNIYPALNDANDGYVGSTTGGMAMYGYFGTTLYQMFRVMYEESATNPNVYLSSPAQAYVHIGASSLDSTHFHGVVNFSDATVTGLSVTATFG